MVCASVRVRSGVEVNKACRSAMLHYRSPFLETLTTLTLSPLLVFGQTEEKQSIIVELFSDFEEDQVSIAGHLKVWSHELIYQNLFLKCYLCCRINL